MHGSGSGPLGALLLIVPLAAIPVFAIVGVPQFAPLIASPSEDEDLVPDLEDAKATLSSASVETPRQGRSADDLFAPLPDSSRANATPSPKTDTRPFFDPKSKTGEPGQSAALPPPDALDQWEIRSIAPEANTHAGDGSIAPDSDASPEIGADPSETLEIPTGNTDEGKVSAVGFSPDLLKLDPANRMGSDSRPAPRGTPGPPAASRAAPRNSREAAPVAALSRPAAARSLTLDEQPGWQAAARRLKELGISKYRLEWQIEKQTFFFSCAIASPDNPRIARRFEADADSPLEAVQNVLEQIDEWRSRDSRTKLAAIPAVDDR